MSKNVSIMENKETQSFNGVKKIQTNLVEDKTQYWVPEDEAYLYLKTKKLSVSKNGIYDIKDENKEGSSSNTHAYSEVVVKVADEKYKTNAKKITKNGTYSASEDGSDAYSKVQVEVGGVIKSGQDYTYQWEKIDNIGLGTSARNNVLNRCVECDGYIYIMTAPNGSFKRFNGSAWDNLQALPNFSGNARICTYNNEIHALDGYNHYVFDGSAWQLLSIQNPVSMRGAPVIEYQGKIHAFYYFSSSNTHHYVFDGSTWAEEANGNIPAAIHAIYVYDDILHVVDIQGNDLSWDGTKFVQDFVWGGQVYAIGHSTIQEIERVIGVKFWSNGNYARPYSYNGKFVRPEEVIGIGGIAYGADSVISSINGTLYCFTASGTYKATVIESHREEEE